MFTIMNGCDIKMEKLYKIKKVIITIPTLEDIISSSSRTITSVHSITAVAAAVGTTIIIDFYYFFLIIHFSI